MWSLKRKIVRTLETLFDVQYGIWSTTWLHAVSSRCCVTHLVLAVHWGGTDTMHLYYTIDGFEDVKSLNVTSAQFKVNHSWCCLILSFLNVLDYFRQQGDIVMFLHRGHGQQGVSAGGFNIINSRPYHMVFCWWRPIEIVKRPKSSQSVDWRLLFLLLS